MPNVLVCLWEQHRALVQSLCSPVRMAAGLLFFRALFVFVPSVSADATTFNVTYQDYGDPTPMFIGRGYNVSVINEPRFQAGELRFIYFPRLIDPARFIQLPGVNGN